MTKKIVYTIIILILAVVLYFVLRPKKSDRIEITHDMIVQQVEELGKLELIRYNIKDIVEYKKIRDWLPNSKTALIVVGDVTSCVDLTKLTKEDVKVYGDSVSLLLPMPEICHFKIDHTRSKVYDVQYGLWETPKLVDEAYREAEQQLYRQALEMGIAQESRQSAVKTLTQFLNLLGFKKVTINFKENESQNSENRKINVIPN
ncbi:MAG: DUF4230 domain-containing protein [Dysgonomonas sp.]